ncbi:Histone deacetylase complex subunit SAP18 [Bienertia sinuspersici]
MAVLNRRMQQRPPLPPPSVPPIPLPHHSILVNREKTCPLLLRVFTKIGSHHSKEEFAVRGKEPKNEFQIYTWMDATLRELTELVKEVTPEAKRGFARLSFAFVFPEKHGRFVVRPLGKTFACSSRKVDDDKALAQLGFQIGDYLDVAIF